MKSPTGREDHPDRIRPCAHLAAIQPVKPYTTGCQQCIDHDGNWAALSICLSCGWVACSDDSPNQHAKAHYEETNHPIATTLPSNPNTRWCYIHQRAV
jgi:uncharacterized UBP type Zn finger protein